MGDTGLAAFAAELVDEGVQAFGAVRQVGEGWPGERGFRSRVTVRVDVGPAVLGMTGSPGDETMDVFGRCVATAFTVPSSGMAMTPAVFRRLRPDGRRAFRKHTPAVRYVGGEDVRFRGSSTGVMQAGGTRPTCRDRRTLWPCRRPPGRVYADLLPGMPRTELGAMAVGLDDPGAVPSPSRARASGAVGQERPVVRVHAMADGSARC